MMNLRTCWALLLALFVPASAAAQDGQDWPQWRGAKRDGVWRETGILEKFERERIPLRWSVPLGGGYNGPTVAKGRVYVMDRPKGADVERILCLDWKTGKELWKIRYDVRYEELEGYGVGPRASVTVQDGVAYALGTMGHLHCLDAATGRIVWKRDLRTDYKIRIPNWGISASPIIEGDLLITQIGGSGDACVVALDVKTGRERWKAFSDEAAYAAPIVIEQGGQRVIVMPIGFRVVAFAPADGKLLWDHQMRKTSWPISIPTPVVEGDLLFFTSAAEGSVLFRLNREKPAVDIVWKRKKYKPRSVDTISSVSPTPLVMNGHVFGVEVNGQFRCLELMTGKRQWENTKPMPSAWHATMHLVRYGDTGDRAWIFTELGDLILARLTGEGYEEITRAKLIEPTIEGGARGRPVAWAHPAYAYRHIFARNDHKLVCADLSADR